MTKARTGAVAASFFVLAGAVALFLVLFAARSSGGHGFGLKVAKAGAAESEVGENAQATFREGPTSFEQQRAMAEDRRSREGHVQPDRRPRRAPAAHC